MKWLRLTTMLPLLVSASLACQPLDATPECTDPAFIIEYPDEANGVVPYKNGGELKVKVQLDACKNLDGQVTLQVFEDGVEQDSAWPKITLAQPICGEDDNAMAGGSGRCTSNKRQGSTKISFPKGGVHVVGVAGLGHAMTSPVTIVTPELRLSTPRVTLQNTKLKVEACLESTAAEGNASFQWSHLVTGGTLPLRTGRCDSQNEPSSSSNNHPYLTHVRLSAEVPADQSVLWLDTSIDGAPGTVVKSQVDLAIAGVVPTLNVAKTFDLPKAGEITSLALAVKSGDEPLRGFELTLGLEMGVTVWPSLVVTDTEGKAQVHFRAPAQSTTIVWNNATYGALAVTHLVRQEPVASQLETQISFRDASNKELSSTALPAEGQLFEVVVTLTQDDEPSTGVSVALAGTPNVTPVPSSTQTNSHGQAHFFVAAPAEPNVAFVATVGSSTIGKIISRN